MHSICLMKWKGYYISALCVLAYVESMEWGMQLLGTTGSGCLLKHLICCYISTGKIHPSPFIMWDTRDSFLTQELTYIFWVGFIVATNCHFSLEFIVYFLACYKKLWRTKDSCPIQFCLFSSELSYFKMLKMSRLWTVPMPFLLLSVHNYVRLYGV